VEDNVIEVADRNCSKSLVEKALEQSGIDLSIDDDLCATSNENWFEQSAVNSMCRLTFWKVVWQILHFAVMILVYLQIIPQLLM
jgi:hypothetical protein